MNDLLMNLVMAGLPIALAFLLRSQLRKAEAEIARLKRRLLHEAAERAWREAEYAATLDTGKRLLESMQAELIRAQIDTKK